MKRISLLFALFSVLAFALPMNAQTSTLQTGSTSTIIVPISGGNCSATNTCIATAYYLQGTCPGTLVGSAGWAPGPSIPLPGGTQIVINTGLQPITQYAIDVEVQPTGLNNVWSGPSNCSTITTPFHPTAVVLGTLSAT